MGHSVRTITSDAGPRHTLFSDDLFPAPRNVFEQVVDRTWNAKSSRLVRRICRDFAPDIVTFHSMYLPSASALHAARDFRQVLFVHGPEYYTKWLLPRIMLPSQYKVGPEDPSQLTLAGHAHYLYLRYCIRPLFMAEIRRVPNVLAFSRNTQKMLALEGVPSHHIPNGVLLLDRKERRKPGCALGFVGRLVEDKGIDYIIDAFAFAARSNDDITLYIAGRGTHSYETHLNRKVSDLGIANRVAFVGHLDRAGLRDFYEKVDLLLMASYHEAFGMVGVEALSTGTPVLAPCVGGISEWLEPGVNGDFISLDDAKQLGRQICNLLADGESMIRMSGAAVSSARKFDMTSHVREIASYLENIVRER
ncbi:glycosyltransferase family 4 protein [Mycolicibacterium sp. CAU 1645]|uniref:Glycosyltransferase family 4 protein n=2 Tax=Mycolicibacterium arenosum TaxID=2952157 RepID=A0ABT1M7Z5_9MYCO|nr:glycosyltransferase family 4 protein [Mycolicibacterium sp. CAU 1645]